MKRSGVGLAQVVARDNLLHAFHRAALAHKRCKEVVAFRRSLQQNLGCLRQSVCSGEYEPGEMRLFRIYDPKPRLISAPCFRDRLLHHALMAEVGPVLDRSLVFDSYACRIGKGTLAAVQRCQQQTRRFPWYVKTDIRAYFASIDHLILKRLLRQRLKNSALLGLLDRIVDGFPAGAGKGLPIGSLTSQHFANYYLSGFDRMLCEQPAIRGMVRYMDDVTWWCEDKESAMRHPSPAIKSSLHFICLFLFFSLPQSSLLLPQNINEINI